MNNGKPQFQYGKVSSPTWAYFRLTLDGLASTLLSIDLSQDWTNSTVAIQSNFKPSDVPNLNNPSLWYHPSENLIYSGFTGWNSTFGDEPNLPPLSLWTFEPDRSGNGIWNEIIPPRSSLWSGLTRPSQALMDSGNFSAWVIGGINPIHDGWPSPENLIPGMVQFDMASRSFSNFSIQCCDANDGILMGALHHVPSFGSKGIFVAMGGENGIGNNDEDTALIDFGTVSVLDHGKKKWWNQTTTGSQPSPRIQFCTAGIASDNDTYEM